jgi:hypothetical protein
VTLQVRFIIILSATKFLQALSMGAWYSRSCKKPNEKKQVISQLLQYLHRVREDVSAETSPHL